MRPALRVLAAHRQPLIKFVGKRSWPSTQATPHAHPAAPPEFQKRVVSEFWLAPERFWRPRGRELEESEIEAVLSGGASLK
ncbi:hypothetical protein MSAN_00710100 [Mycena sanguinolenta]|uniref:Uncharacterized protein n=1 Tax=Mycena sanguinolenta TaxID=230812 RepID=A0A8H7DF56_9AGAR|nr:hypothetical protein MSAN_00710100 [Mycena sanguinolenta]